MLLSVRPDPFFPMRLRFSAVVPFLESVAPFPRPSLDAAISKRSERASDTQSIPDFPEDSTHELTSADQTFPPGTSGLVERMTGSDGNIWVDESGMTVELWDMPSATKERPVNKWKNI